MKAPPVLRTEWTLRKNFFNPSSPLLRWIHLDIENLQQFHQLRFQQVLAKNYHAITTSYSSRSSGISFATQSAVLKDMLWGKTFIPRVVEGGMGREPYSCSHDTGKQFGSTGVFVLSSPHGACNDQTVRLLRQALRIKVPSMSTPMTVCAPHDCAIPSVYD